MPHLLVIADKGWKKALADDQNSKNGLNVSGGKVTYEAVATELGCDFVSPDSVIN